MTIQVEGRNPVLEVLNSKKRITSLLIERETQNNPKLRDIITKAKKKKIRVNFTKRKILNKKSATKAHQGVIAIVEEQRPTDLQQIIDSRKGEDSFFVIIREVLYEHNLGAVIRTAECAGANAVLLPRSNKTGITPTVVRTSMGATAHIPTLETSLFSALKTFKNNNIKIVGIEADGEEIYHESDLTGSVALIVGGEDRSLSKTIRDKCDKIIRIPMKGKINSLNMSVAAGIVIFEKLRQDGKSR